MKTTVYAMPGSTFRRSPSAVATTSWRRSGAPLQRFIGEPAIRAADRAADKGNAAAREIVRYFVGQGVGLIDRLHPARQVVPDFKMAFVEAVDRMNGLAG